MQQAEEPLDDGFGNVTNGQESHVLPPKKKDHELSTLVRSLKMKTKQEKDL